MTKILFVSQYASKKSISGNNNVYRQAIALNNISNVNVEILTTLEGDHMVFSTRCEDDYNIQTIDEVKYHIINNKYLYSNRVLTEKKWQESLNIGISILKKIKPDIVHLQHWRDLWWILAAAQKLGIKTVYSPHDWGLICLRTILVDTNDKFCDGLIDFSKCSNCVKKRKSLLGKINELFVSSSIFQFLLSNLASFSRINKIFVKKQIEIIGSKQRVKLFHSRIRNIIYNLDSIVVPNSYAKELFSQFVNNKDKIVINSWYYDKPTFELKSIKPLQSVFAIGYIGRIASDKGIKRIFEALESGIFLEPLHFVIAGDYLNDYGLELYEKYNTNVGIHTVEWLGWLSHEDIYQYYSKVDISVLISEWVENGPLTLYESFAYKCPVIINNTPNVKDYVIDGYNGLKVDHFLIGALAEKIKYVQENPEIIDFFKSNIKSFQTSDEYAQKLNKIYHK
jgi:glycosyltransferase involved in cell wall biosynthesis